MEWRMPLLSCSILRRNNTHDVSLWWFYLKFLDYYNYKSPISEHIWSIGPLSRSSKNFNGKLTIDPNIIFYFILPVYDIKLKPQGIYVATCVHQWHPSFILSISQCVSNVFNVRRNVMSQYPRKSRYWNDNENATITWNFNLLKDVSLGIFSRLVSHYT